MAESRTTVRSISLTRIPHLFETLTDESTVRSSFRKVQGGPADVAHDDWTKSKVEVYTSPVTEDDFEQPKELWQIFLKQEGDETFINNISAHLSKALPEVQKETISKWSGDIVSDHSS